MGGWPKYVLRVPILNIDEVSISGVENLRSVKHHHALLTNKKTNLLLLLRMTYDATGAVIYCHLIVRTSIC